MNACLRRTRGPLFLYLNYFDGVFLMKRKEYFWDSTYNGVLIVISKFECVHRFRVITSQPHWYAFHRALLSWPFGILGTDHETPMTDGVDSSTAARLNIPRRIASSASRSYLTSPWQEPNLLVHAYRWLVSVARMALTNLLSNRENQPRIPRNFVSCSHLHRILSALVTVDY